MIELVTVVYKHDVGALVRQAMSIDLRFKYEDIHRIHVVINDPSLVLLDTGPWGKFQDKLKIWQYKELTPVVNLEGSPFGNFDLVGGWFTQQALKMLAVEQCITPFAMVLDAKNVFVNDYDPTLLFDSKGRARLALDKVSHHFIVGHREIEEYFGLRKSNKTIAPQSTTPALLSTELVKRMIVHVEKHSNQSFIDFWLCNCVSRVTRKPLYTEFIFYSNFVFLKKEFKRFYTGEQEMQVIYYDEHHLKEFDKHMQVLIDNTHRGTVLCPAFHTKRFIPALTPEQKQRLDEYLASRGIGKYNNTDF